ncbi:MAG: YwaF family protein [Clostridia bacterium]|nr:YwaF family protein [Clostridia bacterium]MBQ3867226.1 YwaF family protein [Clostridia bacterium]
MIEALREFFGFGGYKRPAEGWFSWQHLVFVSSLMLIMIGLAVWLGLRNKHRDEKTKNKVLIAAAIMIDGFELFKLLIIGLRGGNLLLELPLFLCSIPLFAIPMAAFCKGRMKEASLDFVFIFGLLIAFMGTYGAGQNYGCYPVLSFDNVISGITHAISGFAALYIAVAGMVNMKKRNIGISFLILTVFCVLAYIADVLIPYNYMFLMRGDGTPYDIFYNLVNGNRILYPLIVVGLFLVYITVFYLAFFGISKLRAKKRVEG